MNHPTAPRALLALRHFGNFTSHQGRFRLPQSILRRTFRHVHHEVLVSDFDGNYRMLLRLSEHMQRRIFWMGYCNLDIAALLTSILKPGMVVLDVGANIGEITLLSARRVTSTGQVIAFEPVASIADRLAEHVRINDLSHVTVIRQALARKGGDNVPIYADCGQEHSDENIGLASLYGNREGGEPIEYVSVTTVDDIASCLSLSRVDLIKIDVEGGEMSCLLGAENVLRRYAPMLIIEVQAFTAQQAGWSSEELFQYLHGFGYEFFKIGPRGRLKALDVAALTDLQNVLCVAREGSVE